MLNVCHCQVRPHLSFILVALAVFGTRASGADYTIHVVEPTVTNHVMLGDGPLPPVCQPADTVVVRACRGEYEPASFVISASEPLEGVRIEVGAVTGPGGTWPKEAIDVRVVKEYYCGPDWGILPILLVHDKSFLGIEPDPTPEDPQRLKNVALGELRDAAELLPLDIEPRKRFWVTVHVPDDATAGMHESVIRIVPANSTAKQLALQIEVYPFDLLPPLLEYSIYYPANMGADWPVGHPDRIRKRNEQQFVAEMKNMLAHGVSNPTIYDGPKKLPDETLDMSVLDKVLDLRESVGMKPKHLYLLGHPAAFRDRPLTEQERAQTEQYVPQINAWARARGYETVYFYAMDELYGDRLSGERESMAAIRESGGKVFVACFLDFFDRVGDLLDRPILFANPLEVVNRQRRKYTPSEAVRHFPELAKLGRFDKMSNHPTYRKAIDGIHQQGRKIYTYMNPPGGYPMPELQRRNQGLELWRVGFDGSMTWAYTHISSGLPQASTRHEPQEQHMYWGAVFRTEDGVLDSLSWEGFREGVDDVRYLTTLLDMLGRVVGRFAADPLVGQTYTWLGQIDVHGGDLEAIRHEMAQCIVSLADLGFRVVPPEEALAGIDLHQVRLVTLPESWRFKVDPDNQGLEGQWFDRTIDDSQWASLRTDQNTGWDKQGFAEHAVGYGWYRTRLPLAEQDLAKHHKYLYFEAVDEDAWVYVNGQQVFDHTVDSTGMEVSEIWMTPFGVPLTGAVLQGGDLLAVRVYNRVSMGGIWKPVHLILSDQELSNEQIHAFMKLRQRRSDTE